MNADIETSNFPGLNSNQAALTPVHGVNTTKVNPQLNQQRKGGRVEQNKTNKNPEDQHGMRLFLMHV